VNHIRPPFRQQQIRKFFTAARKQKEPQKENTVKMSSQPSHPALMIPGPVEFDDEVLQAMSHYRLDLLSVNDTTPANN
jgi:alanine-glyoxylate transaminase/serine-glyoxylate transaminase/serine-pyruvate transaminase